MNDIRVQRLHEFADQQLTRLKAGTAEAGKPVTCCRGCSACCYEPVYVDYREALHALDALTPEQREYVRERTREWVAKLTGSDLLNEEMPPVMPYRALRAACPFLKGGECMVYERRPVGCRMHFAVGARSACEDDALRPKQVYAYVKELPLALAAVAAKFFRGGEKDHLGVWLAAFLLNIFIDGPSRERVPREFADRVQLTYVDT